MKISSYRLSTTDYIKVGEITLYRVIYDNIDLQGGYMCENSIIENTYVGLNSYVINSQIVDSYIDCGIVQNSIIADCTIVDSNLSYTHVSESLIGVDLSLCTLYGEDLTDFGPILKQ